MFPMLTQQLLLKEVQTSRVPDDLKNGITIKSLEGMKPILPPDMEASLSQALGIPVTIQTNLNAKDYVTMIKNRDFDATIVAISMSYKVISEALNLQYLSEIQH